MTRVAVDSRERTLLNIFRDRSDGFEVKALPCGDVEVEYENGRGWLCERKTCVDLIASLVDGRWKEQTSRLFSCGKKIVIIIEGDLRDAQAMYKHGLGAYLNMSLRAVHILRTWDPIETFEVLVSLIEKLQHRRVEAPPVRWHEGLQIPKVRGKTSKRARDAESVELRQLMCIPSVSERVARTLLRQFGDLRNLRLALSDPAPFPDVHLDDKTKLGKRRLKHLTEHLVGKDAPVPVSNRAKQTNASQNRAASAPVCCASALMPPMYPCERRSSSKRADGTPWLATHPPWQV